MRHLSLILIGLLLLSCAPDSTDVSEGQDTDQAGAIGIPSPQQEAYATWLKGLRASEEALSPSISALHDLIESDHGIKLNMNRMLDQVPNHLRPAQDIDELLAIMNGIIQRAPEYGDPSHFPMSALFVQLMYTPSGEYLLTNKQLNAALKGVLDEWKAFLDSEASALVINRKDGWLCPASVEENDLNSFIIPDAEDAHGGFTSFNAFFHREIKPELRPIAEANNNQLVTLPSDGTVYRIETSLNRSDKYWLKNEPYSLEEMLDKSEFTDHFVDGMAVQTFLSGNNYHRFMSPIGGEVVEARVIDGFMFSEIRELGFDKDAGILSQGYEASVNTRGLVIVKADNSDLGYVAFLPIGITEISSITLDISAGDRVEKGQEIGYFSYGGSTVVTLFESDAVTLDSSIQVGASVNANAPFARVN